MKKLRDLILVILLITLPLPLSYFLVRTGASIFAGPNEHMHEIVCISESPNSKCYHYDSDCKMLNQSHFKVKDIIASEAEEKGYTLCKHCLKLSVRYQWDGAVPYVCVALCWIFIFGYERINNLLNNYTFQSPIKKNMMLND